MSKRNGNFTTGRGRKVPAWKREERDMFWRHEAGYCQHGVYVGGCGADYMCGLCESGEAPLTKAERKKYNRDRKANYHLDRVIYFLKRHQWDKAQEAFTMANRWSHRPTDKNVATIKAFLAYGREHGKFKAE